MPVTPGTALEWSSLKEWIDAARTLDRRKSSAKRHADIRTHWVCLGRDAVESAPIETLDEFIKLLHAPCNVAWGKPNRGDRRNTRWEDLNNRARNQRSKLIKAADRDSMEIGHNSSNFGI